MRILTMVLATLALPAMAAETRPEVVRPTATPQAIGALHAVRTIPEACVRLEGMFTGDAVAPYRFAAVRSFPNCRPRARYVDFAKTQPSPAQGWIFNDEIRVPSAACPSQMAVVHVWRKPGNAVPPRLDAQGRARIYLQDAAERTKTAVPDVPMYAAQMKLQGTPCVR